MAIKPELQTQTHDLRATSTPSNVLWWAGYLGFNKSASSPFILSRYVCWGSGFEFAKHAPWVLILVDTLPIGKSQNYSHFLLLPHQICSRLRLSLLCTKIAEWKEKVNVYIHTLCAATSQLVCYVDVNDDYHVEDYLQCALCITNVHKTRVNCNSLWPW